MIVWFWLLKLGMKYEQKKKDDVLSVDLISACNKIIHNLIYMIMIYVNECR